MAANQYVPWDWVHYNRFLLSLLTMELFVHFSTVAENMPPTRKRKASQSLDTDDQSSSNVLVIKRNRLMVKSQVISLN